MTTSTQKPVSVSGKEAFHQFTNRTVHSDQLGRRKKTEHRDKAGVLLFTDAFRYETEWDKKPYEMTRTYEPVNGCKQVDTFTTHLGSEKEFVFHRIKSQMFRNGEKDRSLYYDPETQAKVMERVFRRDKNTGLLLMTENRFDATGHKILASRRMVNLGGRYFVRTPELDKKLKLQTRSGLRTTLAKRQTFKAIKQFFDRFKPGKSA